MCHSFNFYRTLPFSIFLQRLAASVSNICLSELYAQFGVDGWLAKVCVPSSTLSVDVILAKNPPVFLGRDTQSSLEFHGEGVWQRSELCRSHMWGW